MPQEDMTMEAERAELKMAFCPKFSAERLVCVFSAAASTPVRPSIRQMKKEKKNCTTYYVLRNGT
jgi:hypothetical protein